MAIPDPRGVPQQGPANWANGFLPAVYQGTAFNADKPIPHLARPGQVDAASDRATRDFLRLLNDEHLKRHPGDTELAELVGESAPVTVGIHAQVDEVAARLIDARRMSVVVVDEEDVPVGRILADDVIDALMPERGRIHFPRLLQ